MTQYIKLKPFSKILFEGDSLTGQRMPGGMDTWPWLRMMGGSSFYSDRVADWIFCNRPDLNIQCRLGAVGGSSMGDVLTRWHFVQDVKPAVVVMTVGSNDPWRNVTLEAFRSEIAEYTQKLDTLCGGRLLYLSHPTCSFASDEARKQRAAAFDYYNAATEEVSRAGGVSVNLGAILEHKAKYLHDQCSLHTIFHDGGHFNAVGNEIIATTVLRALGLIELPHENN